MESFTIPCKYSKVIYRKSLKLYDFFIREVGEGAALRKFYYSFHSM